MTETSELRFDFGENWTKFLKSIDDDRIARAEASLKILLGRERLDGLRFLDIGCGSGLSSLAARRLGAIVSCFDYDPAAVACTHALRERYFQDNADWGISPGSILDRQFLGSLGRFDIVYSWGVLHHTGRLWEALENTSSLVAPGGSLVVAIYNDQGRRSRIWKKVKGLYNRVPAGLRFIVLWPAAVFLWGPATVRDLLFLRPFATWRNYHRIRGMSPWRDIVDWVGGYPFEVAKPEEVFEFCVKKDLRLTKLTTCAGGHGCNEYVFTSRETE